jgi:hypothetical protein
MNRLFLRHKKTLRFRLNIIYYEDFNDFDAKRLIFKTKSNIYYYTLVGTPIKGKIDLK